jgi:hypothetical protein
VLPSPETVLALAVAARIAVVASLLLLPARADADPRPALEIASDPEQPTVVGNELASLEREREPRHHRGHFPQGWFLPVGLTAAGTAHPKLPTASTIGGEASVVAFPVGDGNWIGGYVDVVHELGNDLTRISVGPEMGFTLVGVDGGLVIQHSERGTRYGGAVRPMLSFSFLTVYGRWGWLADDERFREIGLLLKFPIHLADADFSGHS